MGYHEFKVFYSAVLFFVAVACLGVITTINPFITLGIFGAFLIFGGAYIVHREGWLDREISIVLKGTTPKPAPIDAKLKETV
jgi:hypothetical protein